MQLNQWLIRYKATSTNAGECFPAIMNLVAANLYDF